MLHGIEEDLLKEPALAKARVAFFVEQLVILRRSASRWMGADHRFHATSVYGLANAFAVIGCISKEVHSLSVVYEFLVPSCEGVAK